jgi:hypothetical protein
VANDLTHAYEQFGAFARFRTNYADTTGVVTLRVHGELLHVGINRPHAGTHVRLLVHDYDYAYAYAIVVATPARYWENSPSPQ